jgi:hypothetical protein
MDPLQLNGISVKLHSLLRNLAAMMGFGLISAPQCGHLTMNSLQNSRSLSTWELLRSTYDLFVDFTSIARSSPESTAITSGFGSFPEPLPGVLTAYVPGSPRSANILTR